VIHVEGRDRTDPKGSTQSPALLCRGLRVTIRGRSLLDGVDLAVERGRSVAVMGPSGSGKTTLLHCIAGLRVVDEGEVRVGDVTMSGASSRRRARIRLHHVGMVFQFGDLLPELTVAENVALPARLRGQDVDVDGIAAKALDGLGLGHLGAAHPTELSGGEVQRVAIARAVTGRPTLLLADEPTGALDEEMSQVVCRLLVDHAREIGAALVVATHDPGVAGMSDRTVRLREGRLQAS
jgi:ABC-type lipoprotein export system ATPase subunit